MFNFCVYLSKRLRKLDLLNFMFELMKTNDDFFTIKFCFLS